VHLVRGEPDGQRPALQAGDAALLAGETRWMLAQATRTPRCWCSTSMFVHLRLHSEFSVVDGTTRVDEAVAAAADGQPALALTDLSNLFGAVKFYKAARGEGVKPLLGAEVFVQGLGPEAAPGSRRCTRPCRACCLLVQNHQGYLNLCELLARAWTRNVVRDQAAVQWEWLQELQRRPDPAVGRALRARWGRPCWRATRPARCRHGAAAGGHLSPPLLPGAAARRPPRRRAPRGAPCSWRRA
jgi:hypothetical protein